MRRHVMCGDGSGMQAGTGPGRAGREGSDTPGPLVVGPWGVVPGLPQVAFSVPRTVVLTGSGIFLLEAGWKQENHAAVVPLPLAGGSGQPLSS